MLQPPPPQAQPPQGGPGPSDPMPEIMSLSQKLGIPPQALLQLIMGVVGTGGPLGSGPPQGMTGGPLGSGPQGQQFPQPPKPRFVNSVAGTMGGPFQTSAM